MTEGPSAVKIAPMSGFLEAGQATELTITLTPHSPEVVDNFIVWEIRGEKPIRLPVAFEALIPDIRLLQEEIDFGDVTAGTSKKLGLTLENHSKIPATLYLDLATFPGFELVGPPPPPPPAEVRIRRCYLVILLHFRIFRTIQCFHM